MILKPEHGKTILVIPDPHDMPGVNQERFSFLGHLEKDIKPDFTVCIGDWPDLASLCSYEKGLKRAYNYRYSEDIESCNRSLDLFHAPTRAAKKRLPKRFMMKGNHDQRIDWAIEQDPQRFEGVISDRDLGFEDNGWEYIRYEGSNPGILELEGIAFSHFFTFGPMNRPIGGMYHAMNLLRKKAVSCIQGHTHFRDQASITDAFGKHLNAVVAGCAFEHFAEYAGANNYSFWRGVVVLTGVENGQFDASWVSLKNPSINLWIEELPTMANHRVSDPRFPAPFSYHGSQTETDDDTIARHRNRALNLVPLKTASSIVIPTMVTEGSTFFNKVEEKLSSFFRGFTVTPGGGSWTDPMGNTIDEHVFVISASSDKSSTEVRYFLTEIANLILDETEEQAVFFSVAGTGFLLNKQENENATT